MLLQMAEFPFLFKAEYYSIMNIYIISSLSIDRYSGRFYILVIMNNAGMYVEIDIP
jgi:hypothetical protein